MTRRQLVLATPAALLAQTPQSPQPQAPPLPRTPAEELAAVQQQQQRNAQMLDKATLPMATEPACHFKAL